MSLETLFPKGRHKLEQDDMNWHGTTRTGTISKVVTEPAYPFMLEWGLYKRPCPVNHRVQAQVVHLINNRICYSQQQNIFLKCAHLVVTINNKMLTRPTTECYKNRHSVVARCSNRHVLIKYSVVGHSIFCCWSNGQLVLVLCENAITWTISENLVLFIVVT